MSAAAARQSRLQSLETIARLLRGRANRYAWIGLGVAAFAIVAATLLSCRYEFDSYSLDGLLAVQASNPALWALDLMPLIFLIWGQYIGVVMSYQASAMVLDETRELRDEASRLQHELNFRSDGPALGLPNRHALLTAIQRSIDTAPSRGGGFAVLVLNSEHYHELEHGQGGEAAAQYLSQLRERLHSVARASDFLCHFGDDEFGLLLPDTVDAAAAKRIASRVQLALDVPISIGRNAMTLRAHIGIALHPLHGNDADTLLRRAETAKFAAIGARRDALVYEAQLDDERAERSRLTAELHGALYHDGLGDEYVLQEPLQPGLPPRLRLIPYWEHPRRGRLAEARFLHLADRVGLVHGLSTWLMRESFARLAKWQLQKPELHLVLRLPDAALRELPLADLTLRMLQSHDLPPQALLLEFSEAALTAGAAQRQQLDSLRQAGIGLCLIGVGAPGASALASLYYPLDEYRLAADLLERAATEPLAHEALRLLLAVTQTQKLRISFPAISDDARRALLAELRGDYVEALSAPLAMSPAAVERWLATRHSA